MDLLFRNFHLENVSSFREALKLKGERVLIYFPHGLGDWVMFNNIIQFLDNSNDFFITKLGDDYTSIQEGSIIKPVYCGINNLQNLNNTEINNLNFKHKTNLRLTGALESLCKKHNIKYLYYEPFPEGRTSWPYNSKPRSLVGGSCDQISEEKKKLLTSVLKNSISIEDNQFISNFVFSRLSSYTNFTYGSKLVLIGRHGASQAGKNWGHLFRNEKYKEEGDEAREFIDLCLKKNKDTFFISLEHSGLKGKDSLTDHSKNTYTYDELFGLAESHKSLPFAVVLKSLCNFASVFVGVPSGPMGVASLYENLFSINLWIGLFPCWYFEPKKNEINLISSNVQVQKDQMTFDSMGDIKYNNHYLNERYIGGQTVFNFAEGLLC
jgi:hypothetical protein